MRKKLCILISNTGTGTNLSAIIKATQSNSINAEILCVITDSLDAKGLVHAEKNSLMIEMVPKKEGLLDVLKKYKPDYICLCGWKQIITDNVIKHFPSKILNLHPGAVPDSIDGIVLNPDGSQALWNRGKLTESAIKNVIDAKNSHAASSIHFLSSEFDFGTVLKRCFEKVKPNDTIDSLYARLKMKENKMYIEVLMNLCK